MNSETKTQVCLLAGFLSAIVAIGIFLYVSKYKMDDFSFQMLSSSMQPTVPPGSRITVSKKMNLSRGDIVAYYPNADRAAIFLSRIVGLPGETLIVFEAGILIDGEFIKYQDTRHLSSNKFPVDVSFDYSGVSRKVITIPHGSYFLICDNYKNSVDSRELGPIRHDKIVGVMKDFVSK